MAPRRRRAVVAAAVAAALAGWMWLQRGLPPPAPAPPPGAFAFAVLGDAPYYVWEDMQYRLLRRDLDAHDLRFVVHVGDIFWHPCSDRMYRRSLGWFNGLRHPVVYTPGDNEWADCWHRGSGSYLPRERLARLRQVFYADPSRSAGGAPLALASQGGTEPFPEFVENARWTQQGVVFVTAHLVGSGNGWAPFPERIAADDEAAQRRTEAAAAWLRAGFAEARRTQAPALVVAFHANPGLEAPAADAYRQSYEPFLAALEEEAAAFGRPVLVVQGDDHEYLVDQPLRRAGGRLLENVTRMQVPGSPQVGWVRVVVRPGAPQPFAFESRVVARWKYW
jgi:hypothetical protein